MDTIYDFYQEYDSYREKIANQMKEFFNIYVQVKSLSCDERADVVEKLWGEPKILPITHKYGENSSITADKQNGVYVFDFAYHKKDFNIFCEIFPEYVSKLKKQCYIV